MIHEKHIILVIHLTDRIKHVDSMQKTFSEYGCYIKTRLGLHDASEEYCSTNGIVILEMLGNDEKASELVSKLENIEGVEVQKVLFDHEADNML